MPELLSQKELEEMFNQHCFSIGTRDVILLDQAVELLGEKSINAIFDEFPYEKVADGHEPHA